MAGGRPTGRSFCAIWFQCVNIIRYVGYNEQGIHGPFIGTEADEDRWKAIETKDLHGHLECGKLAL